MGIKELWHFTVCKELLHFSKLLNLIVNLFIVFPNYSFNSCRVCTDIYCFIPDIGDLCFIFFFFKSLSVLPNVNQFYWFFKRPILATFWFQFYWFLLLYLLFPNFFLLWVYFTHLFLDFWRVSKVIDLSHFFLNVYMYCQKNSSNKTKTNFINCIFSFFN